MLFYSISTQLYFFFIRLVSWVNPKARLWIQGRKNWKTTLKNKINAVPNYHNRKKVWIHVSSLGEFEQGRPVLEILRKKYPQYCIILTFFSPSGYEVCKNYDLADIITYLPADTRKNAKDFIQLIQPDITIWIKYDFWYYFLSELKYKNIPVILVSAVFRKNSVFEKKWLRKFYRNKVLCCFTHIFVQDESSFLRLKQYYPEKQVTLAGDTRYDRVLEIASQPKNLSISYFEGVTLVAGSTWQKDEEILSEVYRNIQIPLRIIIAPHEIDEAHLQGIEKKFASDIVRYSQYHTKPDSKIILIDNFGLLSTLYYYGQVAYIGNGFGDHIHNLLEASVYGIPTIFGPKHHKAIEAKEHLEKGVSKEVHNAKEIIDYLTEIYTQPQKLNIIKEQLHTFYKEKSGAVNHIIRHLEKNYLR
jgi:3-deoxy-D-manno-octulosonic-acid transferase